MTVRHFILVAMLASGLSLPACAEESIDPLESFNRGVFSFNKGVDDAVLRPLARGYEAVLPSFARTGVRNFFSNLNDVTVLANDILQLKLEQSSFDFMRLTVNTTFGLFGLLDVASEMGLRKHNEDFGQTLGRWGVGTGPYLVLPLLGPSNFRDTVGYVVDTDQTDLVWKHNTVSVRNPAIALSVVSKRADLLAATRAIESAALDDYEFTRDFYLERRNGLVYDGKPPEEE